MRAFPAPRFQFERSYSGKLALSLPVSVHLSVSLPVPVALSLLDHLRAAGGHDVRVLRTRRRSVGSPAPRLGLAVGRIQTPTAPFLAAFRFYFSIQGPVPWLAALSLSPL